MFLFVQNHGVPIKWKDEEKILSPTPSILFPLSKEEIYKI